MKRAFSFIFVDLRKIFFVMTIIYIVSCVLGVVIYNLMDESLITSIFNSYKDAVIKNGSKDFGIAFIKNNGKLSSLLGIFLNNFYVSFFVAFLTFFVFGIAPLITLVMNGILPAFATCYMVDFINVTILANSAKKVPALIFILAGLAPHGILEIPAIILSVSIGIFLSKNFYCLTKKKIRRKNKENNLVEEIYYDASAFKEDFKLALKSFMIIILPMLFIAAVIEANITPIFLDIMSKSYFLP